MTASSHGALPATPADPPGAPPTLYDVARLAGFSSATVSRVLTGAARVRPETRLKVEQAVARLGYVRNRAPRSASAPRPGPGGAQPSSIALVVCEDSVRLFTDPFFGRLLCSVSQVLTSGDVQLVLLTLRSAGDYSTVARYLRDGHVDGALIVSMHWRGDVDFASLGLPLVLVGRPVHHTSAFCYVDADNLTGAALAVSYLLGQGRTTVATIAGPPDMAPGVDRLRGYRRAMNGAATADPGLVAYGDFTRASGEHAMSRLLDHRPGLDAVFVASDLMAAGALQALRRLGRRVPDDVAVVGFDDLPVARQTNPALTTVRQPVAAMATRATRELFDQFAHPGREPVHVVLGTELVFRASA